jgi:mono/diheme cytochrome c family protein
MSGSALALIGVISLGVIVVAQSSSAPSGVIPDVVRTRCMTCHGIDLIQQPQLSRVAWERELDKMIRWGAQVSPADRAGLLDYFSAMRPATDIGTPVASGEDGAALYAQRCLGCHGSDIIEQQRLGIAGWRREVDKMVGWGARVDSGEKDLLVSYLAEQFGVR